MWRLRFTRVGLTCHPCQPPVPLPPSNFQLLHCSIPSPTHSSLLLPSAFACHGLSLLLLLCPMPLSYSKSATTSNMSPTPPSPPTSPPSSPHKTSPPCALSSIPASPLVPLACGLRCPPAITTSTPSSSLRPHRGSSATSNTASPTCSGTKGVVVGFDGRHHSKEWAELTAAIFLSADVPVRLFSGTCPTPLVPFTIQEEGLAAGVMVTASHNPASDNGYKLYWKNSAQIIPPMDEHISAEIAREQRPWQRFSLDRSHPLLSDPLHAMQQRYTALIGEKYCWRRQQNLSTPLRVTYTAMHGVGAPWTAKAFEFRHRPTSHRSWRALNDTPDV